MKNWIFIFMISMITLPGYGKVKVQKPKMKHPTAFAILVDEVTYEKIPGAIEAYRDAIEKDGLSAYIVSGNWESPDQVRKEIVALSRRKTRFGRDRSGRGYSGGDDPECTTSDDSL